MDSWNDPVVPALESVERLASWTSRAPSLRALLQVVQELAGLLRGEICFEAIEEIPGGTQRRRAQ